MSFFIDVVRDIYTMILTASAVKLLLLVIVVIVVVFVEGGSISITL